MSAIHRDDDLRNRARRELLRFIASSPIFALPFGPALAQIQAVAPAKPQPDSVLALDDALDVFDFEAIAKQKLSAPHWAYLATGVDDEVTLRANREAFKHYLLRARRMIDISRVDISTKLFDQQFDSPIIFAPVSSQGAFHAEGEVAVALAAKEANHPQILSTLSTKSYEAVNEARGGGVWFQLYATDQWDVTQALVERARNAGAPVLVVTVDLNGGTNRETFLRAVSGHERECAACHKSAPMGTERLRYKSMFTGVDVSKVTSVSPQRLTWTDVRKLRDIWPGKLLLKGVVTREDAELCVKHGFDGIYVSNHGGRAEESGRATIDCLDEVLKGANKKVPVIVDSGFRRGTDIYKALALGASAVCIGRPYIWGLASYGQEGVAAVSRILRRELAITMRQAGARKLAEITASSISKV